MLVFNAHIGSDVTATVGEEVHDLVVPGHIKHPIKLVADPRPEQVVHVGVHGGVLQSIGTLAVALVPDVGQPLGLLQPAILEVSADGGQRNGQLLSRRRPRTLVAHRLLLLLPAGATRFLRACKHCLLRRVLVHTGLHVPDSHWL